MTGEVTRFREAIVRLELRGPTGQTARVDAVVDTGFDGELVLPRTIVEDLKLRVRGVEIGTLADGRETSLPRYRAKVAWDGRERGIVVLAGDGAMLGMSILYNHRLTIDVRTRGQVLIEELT